MVEALGAFPLPVEVVPFGSEQTFKRMAENQWRPEFRRIENGEKLVTDGGHYIIDLHLRHIEDPISLGEQLDRLVGVVEHGLFLNICDHVIVGTESGIKEYIVD